MEDAGYRLDTENQRQCHIFWKNLFSIYKAGIDKALYYCIKAFEYYSKGYLKISKMSLVDVIKKWEIQYTSYIEQLETWVLRLRKGDLMCLTDLENPQVAERPKVNECSWNNAKNEWAFAGEEESLKERGL